MPMRQNNIKIICFSFLLFLSGFVHYAVIYNSIVAKYKKESFQLGDKKERFFVNNIDRGNEEYSAMHIFLNNMRVGLLMAILGFASGGLFTLIILYWNGFLLANIFFKAWAMFDRLTVIYYLKHAPLEIFAFLLFSIIGFKGFTFYKKIFRKEDDLRTIIPKPKDFLVPTILLFIASLIEIL